MPAYLYQYSLEHCRYAKFPRGRRIAGCLGEMSPRLYRGAKMAFAFLRGALHVAWRGMFCLLMLRLRMYDSV